MPFTDERTNQVYFSTSLEKRFPEVFYPAKLNLEANGIRVGLIESTNIWLRDWMPLQVKDHFVKFRYKEYYGNKYHNYPQLRINESCYKGLGNIIYSDIILDGGNCQRYKNKTLITDKIFEHNPTISGDDLINELSKLLESDIIIIPSEPGDDMGHADGIVKFINPYFAFVNDYVEHDLSRYKDALNGILRKNNIRPVPMPYGYHLCPSMSEGDFRQQFPDADEFNPGYGYYINMLHVHNTILLPVMNMEFDRYAMDKVSIIFPRCNVVAIDCSRLSLLGGLMNCISVNYMVK